MAALIDRYGRAFPYLRLSWLEACNFRCSYCPPDGYRAAAGTPRWLTGEEPARLLRGFSTVGRRDDPPGFVQALARSVDSGATVAVSTGAVSLDEDAVQLPAGTLVQVHGLDGQGATVSALEDFDAR